jgi:hypothetical protein
MPNLGASSLEYQDSNSLCEECQLIAIPLEK